MDYEQLVPRLNSESWNDLSAEIQSSLRRFGSSPPRFPPWPDSQSDLSPDGICRAAKDFLLAHQKESMRACLQWSLSGAWPEISSDAKLCVCQMLESVGEFVESLISGTSSEPYTIFPFPNADPKHVLAWLFSDWWATFGFSKTVNRAGSATVRHKHSLS